MLNPKYVPLSSLGCYFVDKVTGLPLTNGIVYFYSDVNRSQLKPVYEITGSPPTYNYTQLSNPIYLSGVGTFIDDSGNSIIPYGYPYDDEGDVENYFIQIYSTVEGVPSTLQWSIPAWPNETGSSGSNVNIGLTNFIPNGQFLAHTDIPADILNDIPAGQITQETTEIAYGNWIFKRPVGSTATDNVAFFRYGEYVSNPTSSPRYSAQIQCFGADPSDAYKYMTVYFNDVNKFSSDVDFYTFSFTANTFNSADFNITLYLIKNYGTGGSPSPTEITQLATFTITSTPTLFQHSFTFGANTGMEVGANNDDFVSLNFGFPTNISFGCQITDVLLVSGTVDVSAFPATTDKDFDVRSVSAYNPQPDGSNLYLPVILTKNGLTYDTGDIGKICATLENFGSASLSPTSNDMLCDGSSYFVRGYSPLGIPFSRLWGKIIFNQTLLQPLYGSGSDFVSTYITGGIGTSANMFLIVNSSGAPTAPANGTLSAGVTFFNVFSGHASGYGLNAYVNGSNSLIGRATTVGYVPALSTTSDYYGYGSPENPGTAGFVFHLNRNINTAYPTNAPATKMVFNLNVTAPTALGGKYWQFNILPGPTIYYNWFTVDGAGSDPAPGGTGIKTNLKSTFTTTDVAQSVASSLSGNLVYYLTFPDAVSIPPGGYWTFNTSSGNTYYVWYIVDGVGVEPVVASAFGISVSIASLDTAAEVAQKTMTAINSIYYAAPDFRGLFLRGYDPDFDWDISAASRFGMCPTVMGNMLGTFQIDQLLAHEHALANLNLSAPQKGKLGISNVSTDLPGPDIDGYGAGNTIAFGHNYGNLYTDNQGPYGAQFQTETSSVNANVNWVIKY